MASEFMAVHLFVLVNQPFVQECVSCPVRGLLPLGGSHNLISKLTGVRRAPLSGSDKNCFRFAARLATMD